MINCCGDEKSKVCHDGLLEMIDDRERALIHVLGFHVKK